MGWTEPGDGDSKSKYSHASSALPIPEFLHSVERVLRANE